jgi:hypothetical protein
MVERSVRSACDRGSYVKLLVPAAFSVVSTHPSFKDG